MKKRGERERGLGEKRRKAAEWRGQVASWLLAGWTSLLNSFSADVDKSRHEGPSAEVD